MVNFLIVFVAPFVLMGLCWLFPLFGLMWLNTVGGNSFFKYYKENVGSVTKK